MTEEFSIIGGPNDGGVCSLPAERRCGIPGCRCEPTMVVATIRGCDRDVVYAIDSDRRLLLWRGYAGASTPT